MFMSSSTSLADRIKAFEQQETDRSAFPGLPIVVRVDGRGFSKFTADMDKPFDAVMGQLMAETAAYLVDKTQAVIGYTQSDEISLILEAPGGDASRAGDVLFGGRFQKLISVIAGLATARFMQGAMESFPEACTRELPVFDARVFQVPSRMEAVNALLARERDATKNAISMAASVFYPHHELQGRSGPERQEMLFQKGINFNDYPARFKRGVYLRRVEVLRPLTAEELSHIPEAHHPAGPVVRKVIQALDLPPMDKIANRVEVIFDGAVPQPHPASAPSSDGRRPRPR